MATAKLTLDKRNKDQNLIDISKNPPVDENRYPIKLRIYHGDLYRDIPLNHKFKTTEWIENENRVTKTYPNSGRTNSSIQQRYSIATTILSNFDHVIKNMDIDSVRELVKVEIEKQINPEQADVLIQNIIAESKTKDESGLYLEKFGNTIIERTEKKGKFGTANWYRTGINAIKNFNDEKDILISDITIAFLENFEAEHISKGNKKNGLSAYLRAVRSIINYAVKEVLKGKKYDTYPWGRGAYSIPSESTKKRAIKKDAINEIRKLELINNSAAWNAKNYFLFMFNNRGINFIDVAKLKVHQIVNPVYKGKKIISGRLEYDRSKTGKDFSIKLTEESLKILNLYKISEKSSDDFVFPIGYQETKAGLFNHQQRLKRFNSQLKEIAGKIGLEGVKLTSYVARHTWATECKRQGISIELIGDGLGHKDHRSTRTYMAETENEILDEANESVVS